MVGCKSREFLVHQPSKTAIRGTYVAPSASRHFSYEHCLHHLPRTRTSRRLYTQYADASQYRAIQTSQKGETSWVIRNAVSRRWIARDNARSPAKVVAPLIRREQRTSSHPRKHGSRAARAAKRSVAIGLTCRPSAGKVARVVDSAHAARWIPPLRSIVLRPIVVRAIATSIADPRTVDYSIEVRWNVHLKAPDPTRSGRATVYSAANLAASGSARSDSFMGERRPADAPFLRQALIPERLVQPCKNRGV